MITEKKVYSIKCDECGDYFYSHELNVDEFMFEEAAEKFAEGEGWFIKDGKHLCPDCYLEKYGEEE